MASHQPEAGERAAQQHGSRAAVRSACGRAKFPDRGDAGGTSQIVSWIRIKGDIHVSFAIDDLEEFKAAALWSAVVYYEKRSRHDVDVYIRGTATKVFEITAEGKVTDILVKEIA